MYICPILTDQLVNTEIWKPIKSVYHIKPGYFISNFGRIYSSLDDKYKNPIKTTNGFMQIFLETIDNTGNYYMIHEIMMIEFYYIDGLENLEVRHLNGNKKQNYIRNLVYYDRRINMESICYPYSYGQHCTFINISNQNMINCAKFIINNKDNKYSIQSISNCINVPFYIVANMSIGSTIKQLSIQYGIVVIKSLDDKFDF